MSFLKAVAANAGAIRKALTPIVMGGIGWATLVVQSPSGPITSSEWLMGGTILASALGVYAISNTPVVPPTPPTV